MTATARKIDGLGRDRLLEFANGTDDTATREALIDLAGKWKHNWIPLDEIAAAIKAKRMKGDGIRRPSTPDVSASRPAGKTRFDPKGAAKHSAIVSGSRSKGKPPAGAQAKADATRAERHASSLYDRHIGSRPESAATPAQLREVARAHEAADAAHHAAGSPSRAEWHRTEANRLHAAANAQRPPAADLAGPAGDANREAAIAGSEASTAARDARHAQIRKEITVKKEIRDGRVNFVASHSNGTNTVSMAHPQAAGVTDAQHRKQVRDSLHRRIISDQPGRRPGSGPDAGQPGGSPNVAARPGGALSPERVAAANAAANAPSVRGSTQADRDKAFKAERDAEASAAISTLGRAEAHDLQRMAASDNVQPRVRKAAQEELDRRAAARAAGSPRRGLNDYSPGQKRNLKETHPVGMQVDARQPGIDKVTPGIVTAHKPDGMLEVGYHDHRGNVARGTFNPSHVTPSHRAERVDIGTAGASSSIGALNADLPKGYRITRDARLGPALEHNGKIIRTTSAGHEQNLVQYAKDHAAGDTSGHPQSFNDKQAGPGKAEAAAEPAAPEAPAKKIRKPSALHQEYRDRRAEQDRRFEAHTGGGVAAQDTHTQEYKDYFGVGDHSTSPQEQRLTFKSFLEERRQGAEYERRQQQGYDAGVKLGAAHGDFEGDTSSHDAEYQHASAGHDEEMFGQGYSDGIQTGAARLEQRQKDNARKMAELEYGRTRDVAAGVSKAAVTEAGHRAAVHAHVAVAKAALAAGRRPEAQHHIAKAQEHKANADRLAGEAQAVASPPTGETRRLERNQSIVVGGPNAGQIREGTSTATAGSAVEKGPGDTSRPAAAGITVEHSGDGTLVHGTERSDTEATAALKAQGFKWSRNLNAWYLPRTWGESTRETRVRGLEARLGDKITVQRGSVAKSTSGADERAARIARNAELEQKHTERAGKLDAEAQRRFDAADRATAGIPFGQPILLGHHSQRGHERALERSHANMGAGVQAHGEAERARDLATSAAARNRLEEDPKFLARRLDRNQAEHRKVLRTLERADPADDHTKRLEAYRQELEGKISADQAAMTAAGGGQHSKATITAGDVITYRGSAHLVHRTNAKSVTVPSQHERLAEAGYTDTIPYSQITGHGRLDNASPKLLRAYLAKPGTPDAIKSRIRAILRDKGESTT